MKNTDNNYKISIACAIFIIIIVIVILLEKKPNSKQPNIIQSNTNQTPVDIANVSFNPTKVALKDDDDNPGAVKLTDFCFPVGTVLFWTSNVIPDGWEAINISYNNWSGRFPVARSDSTNASSKYNVAGVLGGSLTPTPLPPYFTVGYIVKKPFEPMPT